MAKSPKSRKPCYPNVESDNEDDDRDSIVSDITDNLVRMNDLCPLTDPLVNVEKRSLQKSTCFETYGIEDLRTLS